MGRCAWRPRRARADTTAPVHPTGASLDRRRLQRQAQEGDGNGRGRWPALGGSRSRGHGNPRLRGLQGVGHGHGQPCAFRRIRGGLRVLRPSRWLVAELHARGLVALCRTTGGVLVRMASSRSMHMTGAARAVGVIGQRVGAKLGGRRRGLARSRLHDAGIDDPRRKREQPDQQHAGCQSADSVARGQHGKWLSSSYASRIRRAALSNLIDIKPELHALTRRHLGLAPFPTAAVGLGGWTRLAACGEPCGSR